MRHLIVGTTVMALLAGCGAVAPVRSLPTPQVAKQSQAVRPAAWTIAPVRTAPPAVMRAFAEEKAAVLAEIQKAEHLTSVTMGDELAIRAWQIGGTPVGYVLTGHGNVVFDKPGWQKGGAFIVDFCLDPAGNDFGGVYAFTVNSERPISKVRPAHRLGDAASPLALTRVATKPTAIQDACQALYGPQRDTIAAQLPGLRIAAITAFPSGIAIRYRDELVGYIDSQTSSALPTGDVVGIQVLNTFDVAGRRIDGQARIASAMDPAGFHTIAL